MTDVFCAFLLDSWNASPETPRESLFLSVLAGRTSFSHALRKRTFRSHALVVTFAEHLAKQDSVSPREYPLFSQALQRVSRLVSQDARKKIHWDRECALFVQMLHGSVARVQVSSSHGLSSYAFGTFVRIYRTLLGGSRIFHEGALHDTSWIGRVRAFTQRITF